MNKFKSFILLISILFSNISFSQVVSTSFDDGTYVNGAKLADHANWDQAKGASDAFKIYKPASDGQVYCNQTGSMMCYYVGSFPADQFAQATYISEVSGKEIGIGVRMSSSSSGSGYCWFSDSDMSYFLKVVSGVETWADYGTSWTVNDVVRLEVIGTTLYFYRNGSLDLSMGGGDGMITDSDISSGNPGVSGYGLTVYTTNIDTWSGGALEEALDGGTIAPSYTEINSGDNPDAFTSVADATGGTESYTYSWWYSTSSSTAGVGDWTEIGSSNSTTYDPGVTTVTTYWVRMVDDGENTEYSNVATLYVLAEVEPDYNNTYTNPLSIIQDAKISHDQYYVIPDNVLLANDIVGQVYVNCTDSAFHGGVSAYSYSITAGNTGSTFRISNHADSLGVLKILTPASIDYGTNYRLTVSITDTIGTDRTESIYCNIYVAPNAASPYDSCEFGDFSAASDGTGTFASPRKYGTSFTYTSGKYYFFKRGGSSSLGDRIWVYHYNNPNKYITIAAYGSSLTRPTLNGTAGVAAGILVSGSGYSTEAQLGKKVRVYDFVVSGFDDGYEQNGVYVENECEQIELNRIKVQGGNGNGCIYFKKPITYLYQNDKYNYVRDCEVNGQVYAHAFKNESSGLTVINLWGWDNGGNGYFISNPWGAYNTYNYIYCKNVSNNKQFQARNSHTTLRWAVFRGVGLISIDQPTETDHNCDSSLFSDILMVNTIGSAYGGGMYNHGIELTSAYSGGTVSYDTIQRFIYYLSGNSANTNSAIRLAYKNDHFVIRQCVFTGTNHTGILSAHSGTTNLTVEHNLFYDLTYYGIWMSSFGVGNKIINNTFYNNSSNDAQNDGVIDIEFSNNSYQDRNSTANWSPSDSNYIYSTDPYEDKANDIYYPSSTSPLRDAGKSFGNKVDIMGNVVPMNDTTDIGAFEYIVIPTADIYREYRQYIDGTRYYHFPEGDIYYKHYIKE